MPDNKHMPLLQRFFKRGNRFAAWRAPGSSLKPVDKMRGRLRTIASLVLPWLSLLWLTLLLTTPFAVFGWLLFKTDMFVVQAVTVIDAQPNTETAVKDIVGNVLSQGAFGRNILFVQTDIIESKIKNGVPQARTVRAERKLPNAIVLTIQEKTPTLLLSSGGRYYFVDAEGIAYAEARLDTLPGTVLPTIKNDDANGAVTLGAEALPDAFIRFIKTAETDLPKQADAQIAEIHIPSLGAREVYFYLSNNWHIRFDVSRDVIQQLNLLRRVLTEVIPSEEKTKLDYIDLRIPKRIYYKLRQPLPKAAR